MKKSKRPTGQLVWTKVAVGLALAVMAGSVPAVSADDDQPEKGESLYSVAPHRGATNCDAPAKNEGASNAGLTVERLDGKLRIARGDDLFAEYVYQGFAKPIVYPIIGPHGVGMTRNYPIKEDVSGEAHDHVHHKSMWFTHGRVNGIDFWTEGDGKGRIVHDKLLKAEAVDGRVVIETSNKWLGPNGKQICSDVTELTFAEEPCGRVIDWTITIKATDGDVTFGDTKEGTMGIRIHPNLRLSNDERRGVTTANGHATNSEGQHDGGIWGKRANWVDYWGDVDGHSVGIAFFDHPDNLRHPTYWHARQYGLVAANPFGVHDFADKPPGTGDFTLKAGESITFRYRFIFHEGDAEEARIDERYQEFAAGATAGLPSRAVSQP